VDLPGRYLVDAPDDWPELTIERGSGEVGPEPACVRDDHATYRTLDTAGEARVAIQRDPLAVRITAAHESAGESMIHPQMGTIAAIIGHWSGQLAFHAGALLLGDGAWGIMGAREAGKSSLLGYLATTGVGIIADDVLVLGGGQIFAGPRCVDLREGAAEWLGRGEVIGSGGPRQRWRMTLPPVPATVPLRGWIVPGWGPDVRIDPVPLPHRLPMLHHNLALTRPAPRHPERMLRMAALPVVRFQRPRDWAMMADSAARLLDHLEH